jgi:hypothetical protein
VVFALTIFSYLAAILKGHDLELRGFRGHIRSNHGNVMQLLLGSRKGKRAGRIEVQVGANYSSYIQDWITPTLIHVRI